MIQLPAHALELCLIPALLALQRRLPPLPAQDVHVRAPLDIALDDILHRLGPVPALDEMRHEGLVADGALLRRGERVEAFEVAELGEGVEFRVPEPEFVVVARSEEAERQLDSKDLCNSPLVRHLPVRSHFLRSLRESIHKTQPYGLVNARSDEDNLASSFLLQSLLERHEAHTVVKHLRIARDNKKMVSVTRSTLCYYSASGSRVVNHLGFESSFLVLQEELRSAPHVLHLLCRILCRSQQEISAPSAARPPLQRYLYLGIPSIVQRQTSTVHPPIVLKVIVPQQLPILLPRIHLKQIRRDGQPRSALLDEPEEVAEAEMPLQVE